MQIIRSLLRNNGAFAKNAIQARKMSGIAIPSRNKVSTGETIFLASAMVIGWSFIPAWVLYNIRNYRNKE